MNIDTIQTNFTVKNGETITIPYTITTNTTNHVVWGNVGGGTTATPSGTWTVPGYEWIRIEPDMTDWPPDDIIDWFAKELAEKHPA